MYNIKFLLLFLYQRFVVSLIKTVVYIVQLLLFIMSIDLKKALFMEAKPNPHLERFKEIKAWLTYRSLEDPPQIL